MIKNFEFSSAICGFKKTGKPDLAIIYSKIPCIYAGVFTTNQVHAACIDENKKLLKKRKKIRAIVINSGNANACTGKKGILAVINTKKIAARLLKIKENDVLVASTGIIGVPLDIKKMKKGLERAILKLSPKNLTSAAKAILTTDRFTKIVNAKRKDFKLIGFAKGAGMIHPNMATMLCFFMTDLNAPQHYLQEALHEATKETFNNISVDGDMSTNDMIILLSNMQSKKEIKNKKDKIFLEFKKALARECLRLAKLMTMDGEGAKKLISVFVKGAKSKEDARKIAKHIASSTLFKCAVFGSDPNWGRAAARIGSAGVNINPAKIDIFLNKTFVYKNGNPMSFNHIKLHKEIKKKNELKVTVNLKLGKHEASGFGCDMSYDYVRLNSAYFT